MKKVSFVITDMSSGGAERVMSLIANYFVSQNIEVDILAIKSSNIDYPIDKNINFKYLGTSKNPILKFFHRIRAIRNNVRNSDAVISFLWHCNVYTIIATLFQNKKIIISERSNPAEEMRGKWKYFKWFRNFCYLFADKIVFQTEDARNYYHGNLYKKGIVIPNPLSPNIVASSLEKVNKIVAVGRLTEQKNYQLMLESFKKIYNIISDYVLIIYGEGEQRSEIEKWIKDNKLENNIILAGFSKNIIKDISDAKLFLNSSNFEGISNSMLEALAIGIPVVATDCPVGGARQFIKPGINGDLVEMNNVESFSKAIKKILTNENYRNRLSKNASKIIDELSIEKIGDMWLDIIGGSNK